ncbi:uncharacterized protein LOC128745808 [Sabethes cyaneus]|uniref:uncharacterized protein LOC128745808 n=1 Tax=Sabethes cyaneus TaxID=53552 RepID=UPI00237DAC4B|nr:uncharacterized protein LOC128745808 [Sabethes cyaneus]
MAVEELYIAAISDEDESSEEVWYETVLINDEKVKLKLDSGAACNVLPWNIYRKLGGVLKQSKTKKLVSYSNHKLNVKGEAELPVTVRGRKESATFKIVDGEVMPILGRKTSVRFKLIARVDDVNMEDSLFSGLGCVKGFIYDIDLVENPTFRNEPPRRIPHSLRAAVKQELDSMLKMGVIEPIIEPTPVLNAMVIVRQKVPTSEATLKPQVINNVTETLGERRLQQKMYADRGTIRPPEYHEDQMVLVQDTKSRTWKEGKIDERLEQPRSYIVHLSDGGVVRRNARDIRPRKTSVKTIGHQHREESPCRLQPTVYPDDIEATLDSQPPEEDQSLSDTSNPPLASPLRTRSGRVIRMNQDSCYEYY